VIRYPKISDWKPAQKYINNLSNEHTFILMQGNQVTQTQEKLFIQSVLLHMKMGTGIHLFITDGDNIVGSAGISLKRFAEKHVGVLGISVGLNYRDAGVGTKFINTLIAEGKLRLPNISLVTLEVFANNPRAIHMYQKNGFGEYGRLPKGLSHKNIMIDAILMHRTI
jgi:RimJ/RimL family protein N-acetyltransferase